MSRRHRGFVGALCAVLLAGVVVVAGCGDESEDGTPAFTESGTVFEVGVGDEFTVVLASNVTTGYSWELESTPLVDVVRLVDDVYVDPESDAVGAGGRQELTFEAVGEGTAEISLWYVREFDDPKEPAERATFEVVVGS